MFLLVVLVIETKQEPQSNSEEKDSPSIIKDVFSSRLDAFSITSVALFDCLSEKQV